MQKTLKTILFLSCLATAAFADNDDVGPQNDLAANCAQESMEWLSVNPQAWMTKACLVMKFKTTEDCLKALDDADKGPALAQEMVDAMREDCENYYRGKQGA